MPPTMPLPRRDTAPCSEIGPAREAAPFRVLDILNQAREKARAGHAVHHLAAGQPTAPTPAAVVAAAKAALDDDALGYTEALGRPELRADIARHYAERYGADLSAEQIAITIGSSAGFILAFLALFRPGDRVALARPGYPAYRNILKALDLVPVEIAGRPENGFQPTPRDLDAIDGPVHGVIVASPSNPTGAMLTPEALDALIGWCEARGCWLISDEIYHGISYGAVTEATVAGRSERALVVNSFSKYYAMTGWRIGWLVLPSPLVRAVECLAQSLFIAPPSLAQSAAGAALGCREELDRHVARYRANRDRLRATLQRCGFTLAAPPDGAFYLYAELAPHWPDSEDLARTMLASHGLAVVPGIDFDPERGHRQIRLSYAGSEAEITAACMALEAWAAVAR